MQTVRAMNSARARAAILCGVVLAACAISAPAAQGWQPTRPVAFIVGSAPSGSLDLTARVLQKVWDDKRVVSVPVIVVNKPGAGNGIAWSYLNDRGADGHAIAIGTTNLVSNPVMGAHSIGHRDVTPLALLFDDYFILLVRADSPIKTMADVRQRLLKDPAALAIGFGPGLGAGSHTAAAVVMKALGANVGKGRWVPYRSAGEAITAMLGGEIDIVSGTAVNAPPFIAAGRIRGIGIIAPQRLGGALAAVPTIREQGVNADFTNWRAVLGPKGMRREHVAYWEKALQAATSSEQWQKDLERNFWKSNFMTGDKLHRFLDREAETFRGIWADIGTRP
ncbi:MAG: tripartite tricarboxylate transporter substrate binding protein [Burkholderiales bacterium]|nr:tripartite tricarboxylate transporter substrate binding protein [Burkholderiales bacterium]